MCDACTAWIHKGGSRNNHILAALTVHDDDIVPPTPQAYQDTDSARVLHRRQARGGVGSTVEGEMSATIPSDISVMMDVDLRRHHEQSGAWSKKGVCSIDGGKRKRKNECNTTAESGVGKIRGWVSPGGS